jgi:HEAT repeat protein
MATGTRTLDDLVARLLTGERPPASDLARLSELEPADYEALRGAWPAIAPGDREDLVARVVDLAEDNVDLDFTRLARIALGDPLPAIRRRAVESFWESRERGVARMVAGVLRDDPDESVRAAAATALGPFVLLTELEQFDAEEGEAVVRALREHAGQSEPSVDVRARAVESLGPRTLPWVDTLITDAYYDDDPRLRVAALRAMGSSAQERWLEFIEEQALSDDAEFRYEAAVAMGAIGSEDAIDLLADMLTDEDTEVVLAAVSALGEIGGEDAGAILSRFLAEAGPELLETAEAALDAARFLDDSDLMRRDAQDVT